jgi:uncharacterized protein YbaR (Trm112 family)
VIVDSIICAVLGAITGAAKNASGAGILLGLFFGPLGVIATLGIDLRYCCPTCNHKLNGTPKVCPQCHTELDVLVEEYGKKRIVTNEMREEDFFTRQEKKEQKAKIDEYMRM